MRAAAKESIGERGDAAATAVEHVERDAVDEMRRLLRTPRLIATGTVESPTFTDSEVTFRAVDAIGAQRWMDAKSG